jgi:predicted O-methyltransferase YrrM
MKFEVVADLLEDVPIMAREQGRRVYDHLRAAGAEDVLDIGTGSGCSAAYMAAAVDENGRGRITTVDTVAVPRDPSAAETLDRVGLTSLVRYVLIDDSSYAWWLKRQVEAQSDGAGNCQPLYDFCYLDGAHNFTIDGLAVILVEKLLRPGAWLLLDDLPWTYAGHEVARGQGPDDLHLSAAERESPHMQAVFDLIVKQHPSFTRFRVEDDQRGWAQKAPDGVRHYEMATTTSLTALMIRSLKRTRRAVELVGHRAR